MADEAPKIEVKHEVSVVIHDYNTDPRTGHVTLSLKTRTKAGNASWEGDVMDYGCSIQMLRDRFQGDLAAFENWAARMHKSVTGPPVGLADALVKRKGKVIG